MFAHIGFESKFLLYYPLLLVNSKKNCYLATHQSVLDCMTDVLESFLKTMSQKYKVAVEDEKCGQSVGFPVCISNYIFLFTV